jgi:drug/metabolite transporter (DMT)-like permease
MRPATARVFVLLAALLFSTGGAGIKATDLNAWQIAALRSCAAAAFLALAAAGRDFRLTRPVLAVGAAQALTQITFVTANKLTTAANSVFFQGTAPLYIALLGPWWLHEHLSRRDYPVLGAIVIGIALLFVDPGARGVTAPNPLAGNVVGLFSGFCWALTVMGLRWIARRDPADARAAASSATVVGSVIVAVVCLPMALPVRGLTSADVAIVAWLGVFQVGLAYLLLTRSLSHVPAVDASLLLLAEPAFSPVWAWLVHGETPGGWPLAGGILIVGATGWKTWRDARRVGQSRRAARALEADSAPGGSAKGSIETR